MVPQIAAFRRMVRQLEFDVCELAPTTFLIARAHGVPLTGLPIFVMRRFHHGGLLVRPDAGIRVPRDLEGHRVGVRAWSVTTGVWTRAILADEYAVDCGRITWVVDDEEHVEALRLPAHVVHAPAGRSLVDMMAAGELAAAFDGNAGIGRAGSPTGGWAPSDAQAYPELFPDAAALEAAWYARTGIYPIHGTIVVKSPVLERHPWLVSALFEAFEAAKADWLARLRSGEANEPSDRKYCDLTGIVGADPLPSGITANGASIAALAKAARDQALVPADFDFAPAFRDPRG